MGELAFIVKNPCPFNKHICEELYGKWAEGKTANIFVIPYILEHGEIVEYWTLCPGKKFTVIELHSSTNKTVMHINRGLVCEHMGEFVE